MEKKIEKKVAFITGASSGIGLATAQLFIKKGFAVYGCAKEKEGPKEFTYFCCDVTNEEMVISVLQQVFNKEKRLDVVVNCAGFGIGGAIEKTSGQNVKNIFDVNFCGTNNVCKNAIEYLRETGGGKIINIGSVAGELAIPFQSFYCATKAAVQIYSRALANEVKPFNIKVCCVLPGDAKTGFTSARVVEVDEKDAYKQRTINSLKTMEHDEQTGYSPMVVAKNIYKMATRKNPPLSSAVGFKYKLIIGLNRILPKKLVQKLLYKIYAK